MKKTQFKDLLRNIAKQKVSFLSVIVIAMLGATVFLGLDYSVGSIRENMSRYYNAVNYRDVEVISTLLLTEEDLADLKATQGVADVEQVWQLSATAHAGDAQADVAVQSLTERINRVDVLEGSLPAGTEECCVEQQLAEKMGWSVGDRLTLDGIAEETPYLRQTSYRISGLVRHPDHINKAVPSVMYVLVRPEAFDQEALDGAFMKAEIVLEKTEEYNRYGEAYGTLSEAGKTTLERLAATGQARRDASLHEEYQGRIDEADVQLTDGKTQLADARAQLDDGWQALADGEQEWKDAEAQLADAKTQLEDAAAQLKDGAQQLEEAQAELDAAQAELEDAAAQLDDGKQQLDAAARQLDSARRQLESGWQQLEDAKSQIRDAIRAKLEEYAGDTSEYLTWATNLSANVYNARQSAMDLWITDAYCFDLSPSLQDYLERFIDLAIPDRLLAAGYRLRTGSDEGFDAETERAYVADRIVALAGEYAAPYEELRDACRQWDTGRGDFAWGLGQYNTAKAQYEEGLAQYEEGLAQYEEGLAQYEEGRAEYENSLQLYEDGLAKYEDGVQQLEDGRKTLDDSRQQLEDGEVSYADGLTQLEDGEQQLDEAKQRLAALAPCRWLVLDRLGNAGFVQTKFGCENLGSMEGTFSLMFILIAALVIFATISKMVEEQRKQVGTTKALGFYNREIFLKYLGFGLSATLIGTLLGIAVAYFGITNVIVGGFASFYAVDIRQPVLSVGATLAVLASGILLAVAAIWSACRSLLASPAIVLMQEKVPQGAKKSKKQGRNTLPLYSRLILRNMKSDARRVFVTVVSVAGCCALVMIGLTLKTAVSGAPVKQYSEVIAYDERVDFDPEVEGAAGEIEALLRKEGTVYTALYYTDATFTIDTLQMAEVLCGDLEAIDPLYHIRDWKTGESLAGKGDGILIQRRIAEIYGLKTGDSFTLELGGTRQGTGHIAGIIEHYIGRPVFLSVETYEEVFGETYVPNAFLVRLNGADAASLEAQLRQTAGFKGIVSAGEARELFDSTTKTLDTVVLLFIVMSAMMAGVVLMNLTSMYVLQKKRELTVMRINGFTVKEVRTYLTRETLLTTALGIALGLLTGIIVSRQLVSSMEQPFFQLDRTLYPLSFLAASGMTVLFTTLVNLAALRPVRDLKLTDAT